MSKRCVIKVERAEKIALQTVWPTGPKGWIQSCFSLSSPWARMPTFYGSSHNFEECVTRQNIVCVGSYKCTLLRALLVFFLSFPPQYNFSDSNNFLIKIFSWISADFPIWPESATLSSFSTSVSHEFTINDTTNFIFPALNVGVSVLRIPFQVSSLAAAMLLLNRRCSFHKLEIIAKVRKILDHNLFK